MRKDDESRRFNIGIFIFLAVLVLSVVFIAVSKAHKDNSDTSDADVGEKLTSSSSKISKPASSESTESSSASTAVSNPESENGVTVIINDASSVYGEPISEFTWNVPTNSEGIRAEDLEPFLIISKEPGTAVGEYQIVGECTRDDWNITIKNGTYSIIPRLIRVIPDDKQGYVGEKLKALTYKLEGSLAENDLESELFSINTTATGRKEGKFDITVKVNDNPNYQVLAEKGIYTVIKKTTSSNPDDTTSSGGKDDDNTSSGNTSDDNTSSGNTSGDNTSSDTTSSDTSSDNTSSGSTSSDNSSSDTTSSDVSVQDKVSAIVFIKNKTSVYGDSLKDLSWDTLICSGNVSVDELNKFIMVYSNTETTAGKYPIVGYCYRNDWNVQFINGTYTIAPREIKVIVDDQESYVYDDLNKLTYRMEGKLVGNDQPKDLFEVYTDATGRRTGDFDILVRDKKNPNYRIIVTKGTYSVIEYDYGDDDDDDDDTSSSDTSSGGDTSSGDNTSSGGDTSGSTSEDQNKPAPPKEPGEDNGNSSGTSDSETSDSSGGGNNSGSTSEEETKPAPPKEPGEDNENNSGSSDTSDSETSDSNTSSGGDSSNSSNETETTPAPPKVPGEEETSGEEVETK